MGGDVADGIVGEAGIGRRGKVAKTRKCEKVADVEGLERWQVGNVQLIDVDQTWKNIRRNTRRVMAEKKTINNGLTRSQPENEFWNKLIVK